MNKPNTHGGGANTNANGLLFEQQTSLKEALNNSGYYVEPNGEVSDSNGTRRGYCLQKHDFNKCLKDNNVDLDVNSQILLPDDAFINVQNHKIYIIEKKFQNCYGSVDEKLQTCAFKKWHYNRLANQILYTVEYIYVLNDWFSNHRKYKDVLDWIKLQGCHYYFYSIPLQLLGL
ncbi:MAG: hypothetical protein NC205_07855 [Prevotella sp.]|nr:hypothetical protein [Alistipes senegalensis]MCM1358495.1 hypothetical protein [Prevotella sp.]